MNEKFLDYLREYLYKASSDCYIKEVLEDAIEYANSKIQEQAGED